MADVFPHCSRCGFWFWDEEWHSYVPSWRWPGWNPRQEPNTVCGLCAKGDAQRHENGLDPLPSVFDA